MIAASAIGDSLPAFRGELFQPLHHVGVEIDREALLTA